MVRIVVLLSGLLGLGLAGGLAAIALGRPLEQGPVYSVAQMQAKLEHQPGAWVGRTVRVRGVVWPCRGWAYGPCLGRSPFIADFGADAGLAMAPQTTNPLLAVVRAAPLVGRLVPAGQALRWGALASYRVQIRALPIASCPYWPCFEAMLLDVAVGPTCYHAVLLHPAASPA